MILHIWKKDVRRLWPFLIVTLIMIVAMVRQDRWRADFIPSESESYLNLLLPLLWACVAGLAVEQEPLVGDTHFWVTRPYRRGSLLAAKALLVLLFVHLPMLVADAYVLGARGFSPLAYLPQLLVRQLVLTGAVTIPAMALASLVRNFTQFFLEVVAVIAVLVLASGVFWGAQLHWEPLDTVRRQMVLLIAAGAGMVIVALQYFGHRVVLSRAIGLGAGTGAALLFSFLLPQSAFAVRSAIAPAKVIPQLHIVPGAPPSGYASAERVTVSIPIAISGFGDGLGLHGDSIYARVSTSGGAVYESAMRTRYRPFEKTTFQAYLRMPGAEALAPDALVLVFDRATFGRLENGGVTLAGEIGITSYRLGPSTWMAIGSSGEVAGVGRCSSNVTADAWAGELLKVECESPARDPRGTRVRLPNPAGGKDWRQSLGDARTVSGGPQVSWLSPLYRDQTFFRLAENPRGPGSGWQVPRRMVDDSRIEITPGVVQGYAPLHYELRDVRLRDYAVR